MGLDVPCKQEERKEVLAGGFRLFLPKVKGGQFVGLFMEIRYENLEGFPGREELPMMTRFED